ncbi:MAG TPA: PDZ domain-containing protein, partial [Candidatus Acidoferrum sp.]|nr:PDZ domain-containing protein [Candidatus Acidoferrum sp.]
GLTTPKESHPQWERGLIWTYRILGVRTGVARHEITGTETVNGVKTFVITAGEYTFYLTDQLHTVQQRQNGVPTNTYTPPLQTYDWPLSVGKTWQAKGQMETKTGKLDTSTTFEVKGYGIVRVPAGEFEAFYILSKSDYGARVSEIWYAPKIRRHAKVVTYTMDGAITAELIGYTIGALTYTPPADPSKLAGTSSTAPPTGAAPLPPTPPTAQPAGPPAATMSLSAPPGSPVAAPSAPGFPQTPNGPWLGVPLGAPDQAARTRMGAGMSGGAMVLSFTKDQKLPPIDLEPGDVILAIDGVSVEGPGHVSALLLNKTPGSTVQVRAYRLHSQEQCDQPMVIFLGRP